MPKTFLFYDIETTGLNKSFDQVLQFAAIRTDLELNELERHEILVRLSPDIVPSPYAILTHQISVTKSLQNGIPEVEAITKIHQLMNTPGTISLGYNTLNFDDEFLRFSFHRNLLPPYTHQFANQCGRADLFPITVLYFLFKSEILNWPQLENKISLKLEHLNQSNQFCHGTAHDAMVDVLATLELARRCQRETAMWNFALQYFDKQTAAQRLLKLTPAFNSQEHFFREGLLIDGSFGYENFYQAPMLYLGNHRHYKNKTVWLRLDRPDFTAINNENFIEKIWPDFRKPGEDELLLPMTKNYIKYIKPERQTLIDTNKQWLVNNSELFKKIRDYSLDYTYPKIPNLDIDAALYEIGFLTDHQQYLCRKFHAIMPKEKYKSINEFIDANLREQAIRILARNYPEYLPNEYNEMFSEHLKNINNRNYDESLLNYRGEKRLTPKQALIEIEEFRKKALNEKQLFLLNDLQQYLQKL